MSGVKTWCLRRRYSLIIVVMVTVPFLYCVLQGQSAKKAKSTLSYPLLSAPVLNTAHRKPLRFVLALNYWEQLTMATCNFAHLLCLAGRWKAEAVLPFTFNSRLYGLPNFKPDDNINASRLGQSLDTVYDIDKLGEVFARHGLPQPVRFQQFIEEAAREVVLLHFLFEKEAHELPVLLGGQRERISTAFQSSIIIDCADILQRYSKLVSSALSDLTYSLNLPRFTITQYYCVNSSEMTSPGQLASRIGFGDEDDVTVIVVNWRGTSDKKTVFNSATGTHSNKRITMSGMCNISLAGHDYFQHSSVVKETAQRFIRDLGLTEQFIAVHFRSEKVAMRGERYPSAIPLCFHEVVRIVKTLLKTKKHLLPSSSSFSVVYLLDTGPYSSDTCRSCRGGREMRELLQGEGLAVTTFDPVEYSLPADSGLAAAVEASLLSAASYLVLCGGGGFQNQVALGFLAHRMKRELFQVCHTEGSLKALTAAAGDVLQG